MYKCCVVDCRSNYAVCTYKKVKSIFSIPYVIKSSPESNIDANWLITELLDSLKILSYCGFLVRAIVCDAHPLPVSSFKKLREHVNHNPVKLYMLQKSRKIYLRYDTVHLIKKFPNSLLKCKRFIFPPFWIFWI